MRVLLRGSVFALAMLFTNASHAAECNTVLDSDVKIAAMRRYADLLALVARNGWHYGPEAADAGARRHFEEMKVRLAAAGYVIVPVGSDLRCLATNRVASE